MKQKLIIFGIGDFAQLAQYYFSTDSDYKVSAFVQDAPVADKKFCGLPVVSFSDVAKSYPPQEHSFFIALDYEKFSIQRRDKFIAAKSMGYQLAKYISPRATFLSDHKVGENCFIFEDCTIQPSVKIGNNVIVWNGSFIGTRSILDDHSFISHQTTIEADVTVGKQCFIGSNAILRSGTKIDDGSVIGGGIKIESNTKLDRVHIGNSS